MRTLIGLGILLLIILGLVWYMQRDSSFVSNLFNRSDSTETADEGDQSGEQNGSGSDVTSEGMPVSPIVCTPELFATECGGTQDPVCSVDTVIRADGSESTSRTEYISACHYCKFFGPDNVVELGDERVETQGYTAGSCGATSPSSDQKGGN